MYKQKQNLISIKLFSYFLDAVIFKKIFLKIGTFVIFDCHRCALVALLQHPPLFFVYRR